MDPSGRRKFCHLGNTFVDLRPTFGRPTNELVANKPAIRTNLPNQSPIRLQTPSPRSPGPPRRNMMSRNSRFRHYYAPGHPYEAAPWYTISTYLGKSIRICRPFLSFAVHRFMKWKQNLVAVYAEYKMFEQEHTDGRQALDWGEKGSLGEMREVRYRIQHQVQYLIVYLKRIQNTRNDSDQQLEVT